MATANNNINLNISAEHNTDNEVVLDNETNPVMWALEWVGDIIIEYMLLIGLEAKKYSVKYLRVAKKVYDITLKKYVDHLVDCIVDVLRVIMGHILHFFGTGKRVRTFFAEANAVVVNGWRNGKRGWRFFGATKAFFKGLWNNLHVFSTAFNWTLPAVTIVALIYVVNMVASVDVVVKVEYQGQLLGYIESESVYNAAENRLQQRMNYLDDDDVLYTIPRFTLAAMYEQEYELMDEYQLTDSLIMSASDDILSATGISIDGKFYGAVLDYAKIAENLSEKLAEMEEQYPGQDVKFTKDIVLDTGLFVTNNIVEVSEILELIDTKEVLAAYDTVRSGDTPIMIAARNGVTLDELVELNPDILSVCIVGAPVLVTKEQSFLPISVIHQSTYDVSVPYDTVYYDTSKLPKGFDKIEISGKNGVDEVVALIEVVDGAEVSREIIKTTRVLEPVTQTISRGTSVFNSEDYVGGASPEGFIWPTYGGYISSGYGDRWGSFHTGIDYATAYGTPVVASRGGTIIFSGYHSSYGYLIKIDHGGGLQTWYAHNSKLLVSVGQTVAQGDMIANIGSTGNSSGNHLHFEVRLDGVTYPPLNYLP